MDVKQYIVKHQEKFQSLIAKNQNYNEILFAYLQATTEALIEGVYGPDVLKQAKPRKPRGPNKKKSAEPEKHGDQST